MTVVVAYVPNEQGRLALDAAVNEAQVRREGLVVVNYTAGDSLVDPTYADKARLDEVASDIKREGVEVSVRQEANGRNAAERILTVVDEVSASMLVIGLRRRSPVGKLVLGSTAQQLLLSAPCPVLAVKAATPR